MSYLQCCQKLGIGNELNDVKPTKSYNILICDDWFFMVSRKRDNINGFSINSLGFAGYILITSKSDEKWLYENGPEKLLELLI